MLITGIKKIVLCSFLLGNLSVTVAQSEISPVQSFSNIKRDVSPIQTGSGFYLHPDNTIFNKSFAVVMCRARQSEFSKYPVPEIYLSHSTNEDESHNILGMYIVIGMGKLRYNLENKSLYKFDYEVTKGGGLSLEIPLHALNENFSFYNELGFSQFKAEANQHYSDTVGGDPLNNFYDISTTFSPNTVTVSNIVRYTLTPREFKYYVAIGIYNSFVVSSTNLKETEHFRNGISDKYTEKAVPDPAVHGLMLLASTGFSYRNIGFEIRFDPGRNYTNKINNAVYMPTFMGLLHVRFNPK